VSRPIERSHAAPDRDGVCRWRRCVRSSGVASSTAGFPESQRGGLRRAPQNRGELTTVEAHWTLAALPGVFDGLARATANGVAVAVAPGCSGILLSGT